MEKKRSTLEAILQAKCPRCREGNIFTDSIFSFNFARTHAKCPHCSLRYEREPGFFWSAMYVSYAFGVAHFVTVFTAINVLTDQRPSLFWYIGLIIGTLLLIAPVYFRYSRVIVIHFLSGVKYEPDPSKREPE